MPDFRTETQKLTDQLREAIINGEFKPGDRLPQRKIAERFNTTPIVAREALRTLESERMVIIEPRFGAMVEEISKEKLSERYIIREALEGMAARLACENMSRKGEKELIRIAEKCDKDLIDTKISPSEKAKLHQELHDFILEIANCEELSQILKTIYLNSILLSNAYHIDWNIDERGWHRKLVDAIIGEDPDVAEKTMRKHVIRGREMEIKALDREIME